MNTLNQIKTAEAASKNTAAFMQVLSIKRRGLLRRILISGIFLVIVNIAYGTTWHISTSGSDSTGDGSEANPFATIQHGIDFSSNSDKVLVQSGTYVENINFNCKNIVVGSLYLTTGDTTYLSQTVIDGNQNGSVVVFESGEDSSAVLSGFTITNGYFLGEGGGGIRCWDNSSPTLSSLFIRGNSGPMGGGISCHYNSSPRITNVTISNNSTFDYPTGGPFGGGISCVNSSPKLTNVIISGNTSGDGGGIYCSGNSNPILTNVTVTSNSADFGGGIYWHLLAVAGTYWHLLAVAGTYWHLPAIG